LIFLGKITVFPAFNLQPIATIEYFALISPKYLFFAFKFKLLRHRRSSAYSLLSRFKGACALSNIKFSFFRVVFYAGIVKYLLNLL